MARLDLIFRDKVKELAPLKQRSKLQEQVSTCLLYYIYGQFEDFGKKKYIFAQIISVCIKMGNNFSCKVSWRKRKAEVGERCQLQVPASRWLARSNQFDRHLQLFLGLLSIGLTTVSNSSNSQIYKVNITKLLTVYHLLLLL